MPRKPYRFPPLRLRRLREPRASSDDGVVDDLVVRARVERPIRAGLAADNEVAVPISLRTIREEEDQNRNKMIRAGARRIRRNSRRLRERGESTDQGQRSDCQRFSHAFHATRCTRCYRLEPSEVSFCAVLIDRSNRGGKWGRLISTLAVRVIRSEVPATVSAKKPTAPGGARRARRPGLRSSPSLRRTRARRTPGRTRSPTGIVTSPPDFRSPNPPEQA